MENIANQGWADALAGMAAQPLSPDRKIGAHDHAALVYWSREEYLDTIVPYLVDGVLGGDFVVHLFHTEPLEPLVERMEQAGVDVQAAVAEGRLLLLAAAQVFSPEGRFAMEDADRGIKEMIAAARDRGARQVRFSVDMSYVLAGVPGAEELIEFDASANEGIFPDYPFLCICAYDAGTGIPELVEDMFLTHPLVFVRGIPLPNPYYKPWGEISRSRMYLGRWKDRYGGALLDSRP